MAIKQDMSKILPRRNAVMKREKEFMAKNNYVVRWKPKVGENPIRLLPPWTEVGPHAGLFWRELELHWNVQSMNVEDNGEGSSFTIPCLEKSIGAAEAFGYDPSEIIPCPICAHVGDLARSESPIDVDLSKAMRRKQNGTCQIIDLTDPIWTANAVAELADKGTKEEYLPKVGTAKIQIYAFGSNMLLDILNMSQDDDVTDLAEGRDFIITRVGTGKFDTEYKVRVASKPTPAPVTEKYFDDNLYDLEQVTPFYTLDMINAVLAGGTFKEVMSLKRGSSASAAIPEATTTKKALPAPLSAPVVEEEEENSIEEEPVVEETVEEVVEVAPPEPEVVEEVVAAEPEEEELDFMDEDGDIVWDKLTNEQIADPANLQTVVHAGTKREQSIHVQCFGVESERDGECGDCDLSGRCDKHIAYKKELAAQAAAKKKKKAGKPGKAIGKKKAGKPGKAKAAAAPAGGNSSPKAATLAIEDEMRAALGK